MDSCPSCGRAVAETRGACPHCGASVGAGDAPLELPDLELAPLAPPPSAPSARPAAPSAKPSAGAAIAMPEFGTSQDFDDDDFDISQIEVVGHELGKRAAPKGAPIASSPPAAEPRSLAPAQAAEPSIDLDAYEVLAFADYGPIPQKPWESPAYAVRVLLRQRYLRQSLVRARAEHERLGNAHLDALVALVERTRPALEASDDGARLLAPIRDIEQRARSRGEALESTSAEFAAKVAEIDREIVAAEQACTVESEKAAELAAVVERAEGELSRAEGKQKRVDIEIRAAQQAARAAAGPDATVAPPEHAEKLSALAAEREARVAEVARARGVVDEAKKPLVEQQRVVAGHERRIAEVRKKRKALEEVYQRQMAVRSEGLSEVEKERRAAMADIARRLLAHSRAPIDEGARAAVLSADEARKKANVELEKHVRALDAYDKKRLKEGIAIVGGAFALFLLLLVVLAAMVHGDPG